MKNHTRTLAFTTSAAAIAMLLTGSLAFADTAQTGTQAQSGTQGWGRMGMHPMGGQDGRRAPGVFGTVTAISGSTITIESRGFGENAANTTYTVDASGATVTKDGTASTIGAIAVGDTIMAEGTVSGTSVVATQIRDGKPPRGAMMGEKHGWDGASTTDRANGPLAQFQGNGQPVIAGTVSAVSGSTITITNNGGNSTYTIDATGATIIKQGATSTVSAIQAGDAIMAQGAVSGTSITATSVIDHGAAAQSSGQGVQQGSMGRIHGFFGGLGGFFRHLFGF